MKRVLKKSGSPLSTPTTRNVNIRRRAKTKQKNSQRCNVKELPTFNEKQ